MERELNMVVELLEGMVWLVMLQYNVELLNGDYCLRQKSFCSVHFFFCDFVMWDGAKSLHSLLCTYILFDHSFLWPWQAQVASLKHLVSSIHKRWNFTVCDCYCK